MKPPQHQPASMSSSSRGPQLLNDRIKATEVRLIADDENFGVVTRAEAERIAEERGLDLIVMSLDSSPPVVKLMDFGKYKFEKEKKERESKKKQHIVSIKELKLSVRIDTHDYAVKVKKAADFLSHGHKVKITIRLRGREIQHSELAFDLANKFVVDLKDCGVVEVPPKLEARQINLMLSPAKKK